MHDAARHAEYVRQALRQDKAAIGFLLGAGCPVSVRVPREDGGGSDPLIPDIAGITASVKSAIENSADADDFAKLTATFEAGEGADPNVEDLLSTVRALAAVVGAGSVHGLDTDSLRRLEHAISSVVVEVAGVGLPGYETSYRKLAAWAGAVHRVRPVEVFTTNYDLLCEQALEEVRVPYFDGFVGSRHPFFDVAAIEHDQVPARWVRLWKLHGSINWRQEDDVGVTRAADLSDGAHALIHPSHLKYEESRRMPYLALFDRLRAFLRERGATLFVCGYSFNDEHLNAVLSQGLEGNPTAAAFGLMFGELKSYERARVLALRRSNLSLLAADAAIVGTHEAPWGCTPSVPEAERDAEIESSDAAFVLGDFAAFGLMLAEMIGERPGLAVDGG